MTDLDKLLSEIEGRCDAATKGPWPENAMYNAATTDLPRAIRALRLYRHEMMRVADLHPGDRQMRQTDDAAERILRGDDEREGETDGE